MKPATGRSIYKAHPSSEWYTPAPLRTLAWQLFGGYPDLDPATNARNPLLAASFVTREQDALRLSWVDALVAAAQQQALDLRNLRRPLRLWLNPPYGREISQWLERLETACEHFRGQLQAIALLPARPGARWYAAHTTRSQLSCELHGRFVFEQADGTVVLDQKGRPMPARWGNTLIYRGPNRAHVARVLNARWGVVHLMAPSPKQAPRVDARQAALTFS